MALKSEHRVFFAIPFDAATLSMYESVSEKLRRVDPGLTTAIGAQEIGPSPEHGDVASFRAQNADLVERFVRQIRSADVIVADLTNNNPNVHVELGIALTLNKNILRVTGRSSTELGFDIRGLEIYQYQGGRELLKRIRRYMTMFKRIKNLPLNRRAGALYRRDETVRNFEANVPAGWHYEPLSPGLRDGAVRVRFEFANQQQDEDWFGVYLRASGVHPGLSSCLVYARRDGRVEIASYPGTRVRRAARLSRRRLEGETELLVEIEGDTVQASLGGRTVRFEGLETQQRGLVGLGAWQSSVRCSRIEVVERDTIEGNE